MIDRRMGHENRDMGTRYAMQLIENIDGAKNGLGGWVLELPSLPLGIAQLGQLSEANTQSAKAA